MSALLSRAWHRFRAEAAEIGDRIVVLVVCGIAVAWITGALR